MAIFEGKTVLIPSKLADRILPVLHSKGVVNRHYRTREIQKDGHGMVVIPLNGEIEDRITAILEREDIDTEGLEFSEGGDLKKRIPFRRPRERIREDLEILEKQFPGKIIADRMPSKWDLIGDIAVIKFDVSGLDAELRDRVGGVYGKHIGVRGVYSDNGGVRGEFREPQPVRLWGEGGRTVHRENGIMYSLDVDRLMFSSGNIDERIRMAGIHCEGERVLDMFAGIGYFSLPVSKYTGASMVVSCEKNPVSYGFILENIKLNQLSNIKAHNIDCLELKEGDFSRVIMGYFSGDIRFLEKAYESLGEQGGVIHYHGLGPAGDEFGPAMELFGRVSGETGREHHVLLKRRVKSYSPGIYHVVCDVRVGQVM